MATVNEHALHHGLSSASLDKIIDGWGESSPGYRMKDSRYRILWAEYCANPEAFVMTFPKAKLLGNIQPVLLWDNVSVCKPTRISFGGYEGLCTFCFSCEHMEISVEKLARGFS
jgi:hypothetical protein